MPLIPYNFTIFLCSKTLMASIGEDALEYQVWVLKVWIYCKGCSKKVRKVLKSIDGVYKVMVDDQNHKVIVIGDIDPQTLIKKLAKVGKHAELCHEESQPDDPNDELNEAQNKKKMKNKKNEGNRNIKCDQSSEHIGSKEPKTRKKKSSTDQKCTNKKEKAKQKSSKREKEICDDDVKIIPVHEHLVFPVHVLVPPLGYTMFHPSCGYWCNAAPKTTETCEWTPCYYLCQPHCYCGGGCRGGRYRSPFSDENVDACIVM